MRFSKGEMKGTLICLVIVLLFVSSANAQTKTMTGTVVDVEYGNRWASIIVKVGNKKFYIQTSSAASPADPNQEVAPTPRIVGKVEEVGRKVQIFYTRIDNSSEFDGEVRATKIVEIKGQASKPQNVGTRRPSKPNLGSGIFTGVVSFVGKNGRRVTDIWVKSGEYTLMLDARSAVVVGDLSDGVSVRIAYENLQNSEMDIGRAFSGKAIRIVIL
jgi:hypothetical protein